MLQRYSNESVRHYKTSHVTEQKSDTAVQLAPSVRTNV